MRILLIDDTRSASIADNFRPINEKGHPVGDAVVVICRTYRDGLAELKDGGPWNLLLLDHDLASYDEHGKEQNGYHILCFLEENPSFIPERIHLVTGNMSVGDKMNRLCKRLEAMRCTLLRDEKL